LQREGGCVATREHAPQSDCRFDELSAFHRSTILLFLAS
jgi:hypothetical protein